MHVGHTYVEVLGDPLLDLLDGDPPVVGAQQVVEHLLGRFERDRAADQGGVGHDPVERAFQFAHVRGDLVGQELEHLGRNAGARLLGLGLENAQAQFVGRRVDVGDQAPAEPGAHALLDAFQVRGALVGRDHDLAVLIDQGVEGVEELLLGRVAAADELEVVDHQHVDRAELLLEGHGVFRAQGTHELVHELLCGEIDDAPLRGARRDLPRDTVHQVSLAEPDRPVEEQRIERHRAGLGHAPGGGVGELVRFADHEVVEGEALVERRAHVRVGRGSALGRRRPVALAGGLGRLRAGLRRCTGPLRARPRRRLDDDLNVRDPVVLVPPQRVNLLGVVAHHPVAHEARRHRHAHHALLRADHREGLQPTSVSGIADFRSQPPFYPCPFFDQQLVADPIRQLNAPPKQRSPKPRVADTPSSHVRRR